MVMFAGFFDESTDVNSVRACYTVAGYIGDAGASTILDLRWRNVLQRYNLKYYKASEIENGWGQFRQYREKPSGALTDGDLVNQRQIKDAFLDVICSDDALIGISASALLRDWDTFGRDHPELRAKLPSDLYTLCAQVVLMEAGLHMFDHNAQAGLAKEYWKQGLLYPIFDSHKEYEPIFRAAYPLYKLKNPKSSKYLMPPTYEREDKYVALQAADLLCHEVRRSVAAHYKQPGYKFSPSMERLLEKQRKMYVLDYETLKRLANVQSPDSLGISAVYERTNRPAARSRRPIV